MKRKITFISIMILLCFTMIAVSSFYRQQEAGTLLAAEAPSGTWIDDGNFASSYESGTGTEADPFIIANEEQLAKLMNDSQTSPITSYFKMDLENGTKKLDMMAHYFVPIGVTSTNSFNGVFDGSGCEVELVIDTTNTGNYAMFGFVDYSALSIIKNLTVSGSVTSVTSDSIASYVAGIVANNIGGTIINCVNNATIIAKTANTNVYVGGISGQNHNSGTSQFTPYISGCINNGSVTAESTANTTVAGISGYNISVPISDCINNGEIIGNGNYVGGITGNVRGTIAISRCINTGDVYGNDSVGGIYGYSMNITKVNDCVNTGDISATNFYAGGIGGRSTLSIDYSNLLIQNCYNAGNITANSYAGGLVGHFILSQASNATITLTNLYSRGVVSGEKHGIGAIVGYKINAATISNCYYDTNVLGDFTPAAGYYKAGYGAGSTVTPTSGNTAPGITAGNANFSRTTVQMTGLTAIGTDTMNFTYTEPDTAQNNWIVEENTTGAVYYPQLKALVDLGGEFASLSLASAMVTVPVLITDDFIDTNFLAVIYNMIGKTEGDPIYASDVEAITSLDVNTLNISSLAGIEHFTALEYLDCSSNLLTELDITGLTSLVELDCSNNQLTSINVIGCTALGYLDCTQNNLASESEVIGFTGSWDGTNCIFNPQNGVDITAEFTDPALRAYILEFAGKSSEGKIYDNDLTGTDILNITDCDMTSIAGIEYFVDLESLTISNCSNLVTLDLTKLTWVKSFSITDNESLTILILTDLVNINGLYLDGNDSLTSLDLSELTGLKYLTLMENENLTTISFEGLVNLTDLTFNDNDSMETLDLSELIGLVYLTLMENENLDSISLDGLINITYLTFNENNSMETLNLSALTSLQIMTCYYNENLSTLELTGLVNLTYLELFGNNNMVSLDLNNLTGLEFLTIMENEKLTTLALTGLVNLQSLLCSRNRITELSVTGLTALDYINCSFNLLTTLDLTGILNLGGIDCSYNYFPDELEVTGFTYTWDGLNYAFGPQIAIPAILTVNLPDCLEGVTYDFLLENDSYDVVWSITQGELPTGLTLNENGMITGIPTQAGTYTFTVRATNLTGYSEEELAITIEHDYQAGTPVLPTCLEDGYTLYSCTHCDDEYEGDFIPARGHNHQAGTPVLPTCTEEGYTLYGCTECDDEIQDDFVPANGHNHQAGLTALPTCTEEGYTLYGCTECDDEIQDDFVPANGHTRQAGLTVLPTCTEEGYTLYGCTECDDEIQDDFVPANGHNHQAGITVEPTCTEEGYTLYGCTECDDEIQDDFVPANGHNHQAGLTYLPSCTEEGYTLYSCTECDDEIQDDIVSALGHDYSWIVTTDPTESTDGEATGTCVNDDTHVTTVLIPELNKVDYTYSVPTEATCTTPGVGRYTLVDTTYGTLNFEVAISATSHDLTHKEAIQATYTTAGATEYWYCNDCSKYFSNALGTVEIELSSTVIDKLIATISADENSSVPEDFFAGYVLGTVLSEPDREGYIFEGWYKEAAFTTLITTITETDLDTSGSIVIYAKWTAITKPAGGLSGGAVAGITIGSALVLGTGGFSVFWFIIKKKKFADLLAVFKKGA